MIHTSTHIGLAEAHRDETQSFTADGLATAWYTLAPLPDGRWAVQSGAWAQGVGTADHPWALYETRAECLLRFFAAVEEICTQDLPGIAPVEAAARAKLLSRIDAHAEEIA